MIPKSMWSNNANVVLSLFDLVVKEDGYSTDKLEQLQSGLHVRLPTALVSAYLSCGRRTDIWALQNCLFKPTDVFWDDDYLVIGAENQGVWWAAVRTNELAQPNSSVYKRSSDEGEAWVKAWPTVSDFLDYMSFGNALCGGAAIVGEVTTEISCRTLQGIRDIRLQSGPMELVWEGLDNQWELLVAEGLVIDPYSYFDDSIGLNFTLAARSQDVFHKTVEQLNGKTQRTWEILNRKSRYRDF